MWYYEIAHQPQGPVDAEAIKQMLAAGTLNGLTLVWREGMTDWKPLQQTELAAAFGTALPAVTPPLPSAVNTAVNYQIPTRVKFSSIKKLFIWWLVLAGIGGLYFVLNQILPKNSVNISLACISEIPIIAAAILLFILLYKFWQVVQDGFARTSPAKAVGFLFIPFFNLYWNFPAYFGLAKDLNRYISAHFGNNEDVQNHKTHPFIFPIYIVFSYLSMGFFYFVIAKSFIGALSSHANSAAYTNSLQALTLPTFIITLINIVFQIILLADYYRAAKSILTTEEAN
jgi:hypothetical protein